MIHRFALSDEESNAEFQHVSKDLLEHNAAQGVNYWAGSPFPTMLIWAGRVYDFLRVMEEIVGFYPAWRQSYLVGYRSGADGAAVNETVGQERQDEIVVFHADFGQAGGNEAGDACGRFFEVWLGVGLEDKELPTRIGVVWRWPDGGGQGSVCGDDA